MHVVLNFDSVMAVLREANTGGNCALRANLICQMKADDPGQLLRVLDLLDAMLQSGVKFQTEWHLTIAGRTVVDWTVRAIDHWTVSEAACLERTVLYLRVKNVGP